VPQGHDPPVEARRVIYAFAGAILLFVVGQIVHPGFASRNSIQEVLVIASFVGLVACGQMFVILIGGIDLSVPWVLNGAAILLVTSALGQNSRILLAVPLVLIMGLAIGLVNGAGVAYLNIPAVVMTLGMNGIMQGLTLGLSNGLTCSSCASYAPSVLQNVVNGQLFGIPGELILWLGLIVVVTFALGSTTFGRRIYAIGNNAEATYLSGIYVKRVTVVLYMLSGMFSALAGIVLVSFGGQASLGMGDPYLFQSIAAVVIGGVYILGGRGNYLGTTAGAITLVALVSILLAENMPDYGRSIIYGVVLLAILLLYGREEREA
jgi:ribose transport system permease protein